MRKHIYFLAIVCSIFSIQTSFSQNEDPIIIQGNSTRSLEPAYRSPESPKILDTVFPISNTNYPLISIYYEPEVAIEKITPATVSMTQKLPQLYHWYTKLGVGTVLMPMAEIYYNSGRDRKRFYGGSVKHLSSFGPIRKQAPANFDRSAANVFLGVAEKRYHWLAELNYKNQGLHFYGFENPNADADSIAQRFNDVGGKAFFSRHRHDSLGVNWTGLLEYNYFNDKRPSIDSIKDWRAREHYVVVGAKAWYRWGDEVFAADMDVKVNAFRYGVPDNQLSTIDTAIVNDNTIFSLRPNITTYSKNGRLKAKLGINITGDFGKKNYAHLYPDMEVKYSLFDDILIPYATFKGGLTQNTLKHLTSQNEFMLTNLRTVNESKTAEIAGGLKGTIARRLGFNLMASFGNIKGKSLFVNDTLYSAGNRFGIVVDTINVATFEGSLNYQFIEKTKIDIIGRFHSYQARNNIYAWNLPQMQFIVRGTYNLYDKFIIQLEANLEGGRKAKVFAPGDDIVLESGQYAKTLGFIADANLSLEYRYNKRVSAFLNLNNVAAQRYSRWYGYPVMSFQALGGITFRF